MISFSSRKEYAKCLSNFSLLPIIIDNNEYYDTAEHYFHGKKYALLSEYCRDQERKKQMMDYSKTFQKGGGIVTPSDAKRKGGKNGFPLSDKELEMWDNLSIKVQNFICDYKVKTYPEVREVLKETQSKLLIHPAFRCKDEDIKNRKWEGRLIVNELGKPEVIGGNMLGNIWMEIRTKLAVNFINIL